MTFQVRHQTCYSYSQPVNLGTHYLFFKPLERAWLTVKNFKLHVQPVPDIIAPVIDSQCNQGVQVWFRNSTDVFAIDAEFEVETTPYNPFNFLIDPIFSLNEEEVPYKKEKKALLKPFLESSSHELISKFVKRCKKDCKDNVVSFLATLVDRVYRNWSYRESRELTPLDAVSCFKSREGTCRDFSWMLITMLRTQGFASRFVSGYTCNHFGGGGHELHAWVEVLLPGAGWIGLDPSSGLFTDQNYLPVATGVDISSTMSVTGHFRGQADSTLKTSIDIQEI